MEVARERVRGGRPLPGARAVQPRRELRVAPHQAPAARAHRRREVRLQRALRPARLAGGRGLRPGAAPAHRPCSVACTCTGTCVAQVCACVRAAGWWLLLLRGKCCCSVAQAQLVGGWWYNVSQRSQGLPAELHSATHGLRGHALITASPLRQASTSGALDCMSHVDFWRHLDRAVSQAKPRRLSCRA